MQTKTFQHPLTYPETNALEFYHNDLMFTEIDKWPTIWMSTVAQKETV
jgi:hypothetical protein